MKQFKQRMTVAIVAFAAAAILIAVGPRSAQADSITFDLATPNTDLSAYAGPYVNILLTRTSTTTATVVFTSQTTGGITFLMADGGVVALNVNATSFSSSITQNSPFGASIATSFTGPGQNDGFGIFNLKYTNFDGYNQAADQVTLLLTNNSGTWASAYDVLAPNSGGYAASVHAFACTAPCTRGGGALVTGYAAGTAPVPEPASTLLFGVGSLLAGAAIRRRS